MCLVLSIVLLRILHEKIRNHRVESSNVISGTTINQLANVFRELQNLPFVLLIDRGHVETYIKFQ